jgi:hypothetical protein
VTAFIHSWVVHGAHEVALHRGIRNGCSGPQRGLQRRRRAASSIRPRYGTRRSPGLVVMRCRPSPPRTPTLVEAAERTRPARSCRGSLGDCRFVGSAGPIHNTIAADVLDSWSVLLTWANVMQALSPPHTGILPHCQWPGSGAWRTEAVLKSGAGK